MTYILSKSHATALFWALEAKLPLPQWKYVHRLKDILGVTPGTFYLVGPLPSLDIINLLLEMENMGWSQGDFQKDFLSQSLEVKE